MLYEPPFLVDETRPRPPADLAQQVAALVSAGRRGEAVELFQTQGVGMPEEVVGLRDAPFRPGLEAIAHTLVYDATITGDLTLPAEMLAAVATPTLVIAGGDSPPFLQDRARAVADALRDGRLRTLAGETHHLNPEATAPVVEAFLVG